MGSRSHSSAAQVKSVHQIFLEDDSQLSFNLTFKSCRCPELNLRLFNQIQSEILMQFLGSFRVSLMM